MKTVTTKPPMSLSADAADPHQPRAEAAVPGEVPRGVQRRPVRVTLGTGDVKWVSVQLGQSAVRAGLEALQQSEAQAEVDEWYVIEQSA